MKLAVKCLPTHEMLKIIEQVKIPCVEVFTNAEQIDKQEITDICKEYNFEYALHSPNDIYAPEETFKLAKKINAKIVVTHAVYWEDEWPEVIAQSEKYKIPLAIENVDGMIRFQKVFMRYKNVCRCLDFEHLLFQLGCFNPGVLRPHFSNVKHVHLTGFEKNKMKHHTHFYEATEQSYEILKFLKEEKYDGFIVSEAKVEYQTKKRFEKLKDFYDKTIEKIL